jgi:hypothetical protein
VCVRVRERESEGECVCVKGREKGSVCVRESEREKETERKKETALQIVNHLCYAVLLYEIVQVGLCLNSFPLNTLFWFSQH